MKFWNWSKVAVLTLGVLLGGSVSGGAVGGSFEPATLMDGMLEHQMPDGAIRMFANTNEVWINPYFSHIAVLTMLKALPAAPEKRDAVLACAKAWFLWYGAHQQPETGIIDDFRGTLEAYQSTGDHDSSDSYAAMYLVALEAYLEAGGEDTQALRDSAGKAFHAMCLTMQPDGLTYAKPSYSAKYLMDNIEVNLGLQSAVKLFERFGNAPIAQQAGEFLQRNNVGMKHYYLPEEKLYAWALTDQEGAYVYHKGFQVYYPDFMASALCLAVAVEPPEGMYEKLIAAAGTLLVENHCARAYGTAKRFGDEKTAEAIRSAVETRALQSADFKSMRLDLLYDTLVVAAEIPDFWGRINFGGEQ